MSRKKGFIAESYAEKYLLGQGLQHLESNFTCRVGEIDLIMRDGAYLVFVEVRERLSSAFGNALESITYQKQRKLLKAAAYYLLIKKLHDKYPVRFDVLCLQGAGQEVSWIKNAFEAHF